MVEPPTKRRHATRGLCSVCQGEFGKRAMIAHLEKHLAEQDSASGVRQKRYLLLVQGAHGSEYWLYLDVRVDATLKKLDSFLRGIWLECCGHLSQFTLGGRPIGMIQKIGQALTPGVTYSHEYDFGSTTELTLQVLSEHDGDPSPEAVRLLARNLPPEMLCEECGQPAAWLGCDWEGEYRELCEECADEEMQEQLLPVVNSPRAGVCGYEG